MQRERIYLTDVAPRDGLHTQAAEYAWENCIPSRASRSIPGVSLTREP